MERAPSTGPSWSSHMYLEGPDYRRFWSQDPMLESSLLYQTHVCWVNLQNLCHFSNPWCSQQFEISFQVVVRIDKENARKANPGILSPARTQWVFIDLQRLRCQHHLHVTFSPMRFRELYESPGDLQVKNLHWALRAHSTCLPAGGSEASQKPHFFLQHTPM